MIFSDLMQFTRLAFTAPFLTQSFLSGMISGTMSLNLSHIISVEQLLRFSPSHHSTYIFLFLVLLPFSSSMTSSSLSTCIKHNTVLCSELHFKDDGFVDFFNIGPLDLKVHLCQVFEGQCEAAMKLGNVRQQNARSHDGHEMATEQIPLISCECCHLDWTKCGRRKYHRCCRRIVVELYRQRD